MKDLDRTSSSAAARTPMGGVRSRGRFSSRGWLALVLFVLAAPLLLVWMARGQPSSASNMEAALEENNRGVGCMEQFRYFQAVRHFEKVVRLAPDWAPGQINLGIALLNANSPASLKRARLLFQNILQKSPDNLHAHYCLGMLLMYEKEGREALQHFQAVVERDPRDASSWAWRGLLLQGRGQDALQEECYRRALECNPYLMPALYHRYQRAVRFSPERARALEEEMESLRHNEWFFPHEIKYTLMGHYADVLGRARIAPSPSGPLPGFDRGKTFQAELSRGTRWATRKDFGSDVVGQVQIALRQRFGASMVVLDYNQDGRQDLFLAAAVVDKGKVRDLLLRNEGNGHFVDVTAEAGLAESRPTVGCCVADVDNDGYPDLLLTGVGAQRLFRNDHKGRFEDVTARARLDKLHSVCLGASAVDLDQDADLDLLLCQYAATPKEALERLQGKAPGSDSGIKVYLHVGEAPPGEPGKELAVPLECDFEPADKRPALQSKEPAIAVAASDLDGDRDLDFLVLPERSPPAVVINDRLLRFRREKLDSALAPASAWNGALVLDVDHDRRSDLLLVRSGKPPVLLEGRATPGQKDVDRWFGGIALTAPALKQATAVDVDFDSWTDVLGIDEKGRVVLLHNEGGHLVDVQIPTSEALPEGLVALAVADVLGNDFPDLVLWSEEKGLQLYENRGNGNHALHVRLVGLNSRDTRQGNRIRCNADGVGAWVRAQSGSLWAGQENTTLSAGLGQSRPPLALGLGRHDEAQVLRVAWPDGSLQAVLDARAGPRQRRVVQTNRLPGSCPILFTWNGERFVFVTDFLGAGSVGEMGASGACRPPRPEESVKIEAEQLTARDGFYELRMAEPLSEITYLDHLQLVALDHPPGVRVYPDERFASSGPPPSQDLIAFSKEIHPLRAVDQRGRDVASTLRHWDRRTVDGFARRSWIGFAEEHSVELDFGRQLEGIGAGEHLYLCLAGWTDYAWPQSIWAAEQGGVKMQPPLLECQEAGGRWQVVGEIGFPAGLPRMMLVDVTGKIEGSPCRLRLRTNLTVYWDQTFLAAGCRRLVADAKADSEGLTARCLEVSSAVLTPTGLMREYSPDGRLPTIFDHDRFDAEPMPVPAGRRTRHGNVTSLLQQVDDCFVVFGPGDDLAVRFDARCLPPLSPGWKRSFVLRTHGYCKDTGPFTATGATVEPLPFRAMRGYPPGPGEHYPDDAPHRGYQREFNTR